MKFVMKEFTLVMLALIFSPAVPAQVKDDVTRIFYIVRHAEKDTGSNPAISLAGQRRAGDLFRKLKDERIDIILISQYRRTAMTADSVRMYKQVDTMHYTADASGASLFQIIDALPLKYKNVLIVGHSNTVPAIIRMTGVNDYETRELADYEYDNFFVVKQIANKAVLQQEKFGKLSVAPATPAKMNTLQ